MAFTMPGAETILQRQFHTPAVLTPASNRSSFCKYRSPVHLINPRDYNNDISSQPSCSNSTASWVVNAGKRATTTRTTTRRTARAAIQAPGSLPQLEHSRRKDDPPLLLENPKAATYLHQLHIKDFALVSDQTLVFDSGLNVVTGESGSGKSVMVEALGQLVGAPAPPECVRHQADAAVVEGTFVLDSATSTSARKLLLSCGLPQRCLPPANTTSKLLIRREIVQQGGGSRSKCSINGGATSLRVLRELGALLVDTNGQHSSTLLKDSNMQLLLMDRVANTGALAASVASQLKEVKKLELQLQELEELADESERQRLQRICDAVRKLRIKAGEEKQLRAALRRMESRRSAVEACGIVRLSISGQGSGGVLDALRTIEAQLSNILRQEEQQMLAAEERKKQRINNSQSKPDGEGSGDEEASRNAEEDYQEGDDEASSESATGIRFMEDALDALANAKAQLLATDGLVKSYARSFMFDQAEHDEMSDRLQKIERLMRSQQCRSTEELLQRAAECQARLEQYWELEGSQEEWEQQLKQLRESLLKGTVELSSRRRAAAGQLRSSVERCLQELAMGGSRFDVRISWQEAPEEIPLSQGLYVPETEAHRASELGEQNYYLRSSGLDVVEFLLAAGPAEPLRPLAAIASGGESARLMLALKAAPASVTAFPEDEVAASPMDSEQPTTSTPVMILDELDSGIGARLGSSVGQILRRMTSTSNSTNSQIICVTHLPQVACYADKHIRVGKKQGADGRIITSFTSLQTFEDRVDEVAAMIGMSHDVAADMLQEAMGANMASAATNLSSPATNLSSPAAAASTPAATVISPVAAVSSTPFSPHHDWARLMGGDTSDSATSPSRALPIFDNLQPSSSNSIVSIGSSGLVHSPGNNNGNGNGNGNRLGDRTGHNFSSSVLESIGAP